MCVKSGIWDDARVRRMAASLSAAGHEVAAIGDRPTSVDKLPAVHAIFARTAESDGGHRLRRAPAMQAVRWALLPNHRRRDDDKFIAAVAQVELPWTPDVVHAHDLSGLRAVQPFLAPSTRLVYDAHECWVERATEGRPQPLADRSDLRVERELGSMAARVVTVSEHLAAWLTDQHGWKQVAVIRNTFDGPAEPGPSQPPTGLLYAGRIDHERDLLTVAEGAARVGSIPLTVRGTGDAKVAEQLRAHGVEVLPPLPISEVAAEYQELGIGVVSLTGASKNHHVALPNKLFHAVHAGVPMIVADLPQMNEFVNSYGLGESYTPGDATSFATALGSLLSNYTERLDRVRAAQNELSWPHDERVLLQIYEDLKDM